MILQGVFWQKVQFAHQQRENGGRKNDFLGSAYMGDMSRLGAARESHLCGPRTCAKRVAKSDSFIALRLWFPDRSTPRYRSSTSTGSPDSLPTFVPPGPKDILASWAKRHSGLLDLLYGLYTGTELTQQSLLRQSKPGCLLALQTKIANSGKLTVLVHPVSTSTSVLP